MQRRGAATPCVPLTVRIEPDGRHRRLAGADRSASDPSMTDRSEVACSATTWLRGATGLGAQVQRRRLPFSDRADGPTGPLAIHRPLRATTAPHLQFVHIQRGDEQCRVLGEADRSATPTGHTVGEGSGTHRHAVSSPDSCLLTLPRGRSGGAPGGGPPRHGDAAQQPPRIPDASPSRFTPAGRRAGVVDRERTRSLPRPWRGAARVHR